MKIGYRIGRISAVCMGLMACIAVGLGCGQEENAARIVAPVSPLEKSVVFNVKASEQTRNAEGIYTWTVEADDLVISIVGKDSSGAGIASMMLHVVQDESAVQAVEVETVQPWSRTRYAPDGSVVARDGDVTEQTWQKFMATDLQHVSQESEPGIHALVEQTGWGCQLACFAAGVACGITPVSCPLAVIAAINACKD